MSSTYLEDHLLFVSLPLLNSLSRIRVDIVSRDYLYEDTSIEDFEKFLFINYHFVSFKDSWKSISVTIRIKLDRPY